MDLAESSSAGVAVGLGSVRGEGATAATLQARTVRRVHGLEAVGALGIHAQAVGGVGANRVGVFAAVTTVLLGRILKDVVAVRAAGHGCDTCKFARVLKGHALVNARYSRRLTYYIYIYI